MRVLAVLAVAACAEPVTFTVEATGAELVAFQDGDGGWQPVTLVDERAELTAQDGYFGLARICPDFGTPTTDPAFRGAINVVFDTRARTYTFAPCQLPSSGDASRLLSGAAIDDTLLTIGQTRTIVRDGAYSRTVSAGTYDIVAVLPGSPSRLHIERAVDVTSDRTLDLLAEGTAMPTVTPRITGADPDLTVVYSDLNTAHGTYAYLEEAPATVAFVPPEALGPDEQASVGASSNGCLAQLPAGANLELAVPAGITANVDHTRATFTADDTVPWETARVFATTGFVATRISISAHFSWLGERDDGNVVPIIDPTTLPGWHSELPGTIADGAIMETTVSVQRGEPAGDFHRCSFPTSFAW